MKEIKEEVVNTRIYYEAVDGTKFNSKEECQIYEESAHGVIRGKLKKLIVNDEYNCWDLMGGNEDSTCLAIKMPNKEDKDIVLQAYYLDQPWILKEGRESVRERVEKAIVKAYEEQDVIFFGLNCDENLYFIDTRNAIKERLDSVDKSE